MDPRCLDVLCDPATHRPLVLEGDALSAPDSGSRYPIRDGIPVFLGEVAGSNAKYQRMYDRISSGYDLAEGIYQWFTRASLRQPYMAEVEAPAGGRVLEVSIGTGGNAPYLRADAELFGLDLSWGMLRRCVRNLRKAGRPAHLFQGEAERLPFRDRVFDSVFHVGGINFFNDKAGAIREMIRVAKEGTKVVIVDETEKVVKGAYRSNPFTRSWFEKGTEQAAGCPVDLVPAGMREVRTTTVLGGRMYCLTFRTPSAGSGAAAG